MSAVYPTFKTKLLEWALAGASPSSGEFRLALCDAGFAYVTSHESLSDIESSVTNFDIPLENLTYAAGLIKADDLTIGDLDASQIIKALVLYVSFDDTTQLVLAITESTDLPLPVTIVDDKLVIVWDSHGICQL